MKSLQEDYNWNIEPNLIRSVKLALNSCETGYSFIFLKKNKNLIFKSIGKQEINPDLENLSSFLAGLEVKKLWEINDPKNDPHSKDNPLFLSDFSTIQYFAAQPIKFKKQILGFLVVMDVTFRDLKKNQKKSLKLIASQVVSIISRYNKKYFQHKKQAFVSEQKLKTFFENSQGLMCTHDLKGNFLTVNDVGAKILGYSKKEILNLSLYNVVPLERHGLVDDYLKEVSELGKSKGQMLTQNKSGKKSVLLYNNVLEKDLYDESYVIANAVDITEQFKLENNLKHTTEFLQQTNKVARVGGWEFDVKKQTIFWTSMTKEIHGVEPNYIPTLQKALSFYKPGESSDLISNAINMSIKSGKSWDLELQIITQSKKEIWVRTIINCDFANGKCTRLYGTFQDIDEKKKAELEVEKAKKLLDNVLSAASEVSIIATNLDGVITVFNEGAQRLLQYNADEMIGKSMLLIHDKLEIATYAEVLSVEINEPVKGFDVIKVKAEKQEVERREWTYIKKDGTRLIVSLVVTAIKDENRRTNGYLGIATDITLKKKIELDLELQRARLQAFITHSPAAVAMFDNDMRYIAVSQKWIDDYKFNDIKVLGMSHYDLFPNISSESKKRHRRVLNGSVEHKLEDWYEDPNTHEIHSVTWEMRPWYTLEQRIGGLMMFTQDITSIIKQREELNEAKVLAEQASAAKSEFLANISHEIRTPLNGVIGFTDLTLTTNLTETQRRYLSIINQSGQTLLNIVDDILDFSRIEAGKMELHPDKVDLSELAQVVINITSAKIDREKVKMVVNLSDNMPDYMKVDQVRLKQVLINLLGNAVKFTENGEIELKIQRITDSQHRDLIRFSVKDTGIGVKAEMQGKIFEAFAQEDSSTTKKYGGTGLGLTISNKILKMMNASLKLESEPGKGSNFYFDLIYNN